MSAAVPGSKERSPKTVAHYTIEQRLGKGAMGVVYKALDQRSGSEVALKVIASDLEGDQETRARFFREAHLAGQLRHQNIVRVLDTGDSDGRLYIAMELLTGFTLTDFLKQSEAADLESRLDLMVQVCEGLLAAHEAGIYHRDIKPANLFVCDDGRLKLLDFGVARLAGSNMTMTGFILGTPDFMSPEQARGKEVDERSDVFSAAGVFYLMLTGRKPFAAPDLPAVLSKVLREEPTPIRAEEAPPSLRVIVHKGLSKDPAARQQSVAELLTELLRAACEISDTTARNAAALRERAEGLVRLMARHGELSAVLEVPSTEHFDWCTLVDRYPVLRRGPLVLGAFPLRMRVVAAIAADLDVKLGPLKEAVATLEAGHADWREASDLLRSDDVVNAALRLASARRAVPSSMAIARDVARCSRAMELRRERDALLENRLRLAQEAAARQDWETVIAIAGEVEDLDPGNEHASRLRTHGLRSLEAASERNARERAQSDAAQAIDQARGFADENRFDDGIAALEAYLLAHPDAAEVADVLAGIRREREDVITRVERAAHAKRLCAEAGRAFEGGRFSDAERAAVEALNLQSDDADARHLLERVRSARQLQREKEERTRRIEDLIARAIDLADHNRGAKALAVLDEALALDVGYARAADLRAQIAAAEATRRAAEQAEALRQRRERAAAPAIREARRALVAGDIARARVAAESALAQAPEWSDAVALLEQIVSATPVPSPDDTVRVDVSITDDTVRIAPVTVSLTDLAGNLRHRATSLLRRWQEPRS